MLNVGGLDNVLTVYPSLGHHQGYENKRDDDVDPSLDLFLKVAATKILNLLQID